jgi:hypothetical protein
VRGQVGHRGPKPISYWIRRWLAHISSPSIAGGAKPRRRDSGREASRTAPEERIVSLMRTRHGRHLGGGAEVKPT